MITVVQLNNLYYWNNGQAVGNGHTTNSNPVRGHVEKALGSRALCISLPCKLPVMATRHPAATLSRILSRTLI
jgi:hypothetical protein